MTVGGKFHGNPSYMVSMHFVYVTLDKCKKCGQRAMPLAWLKLDQDRNTKALRVKASWFAIHEIEQDISKINHQ